ncbi:MAG TPA: hypothetical protein VFK28_09075 [Sphingomicrobium sp.]|nr:hypothetical protein [Sphingomicrobium sp.]
MALNEKIARCHLPLAADLLALALQVLLARLTIEAKLLAIRHPAVDLLHSVRLDPLTLDHALLLGAVRTNLMALGRPSLGALRALRPRLMAVTVLRALRTLGARLVSFGLGRARLVPLGALGSRSAAFGTLLPFGALPLRRGASFGPLSPLLAVDTLAAAFGLFDTVVVMPARSRSGRGRDRQGGDARGEKYPGHHKNLLSNG